MSYVASKIIEKLESKDKSLPVVIVDNFGLIESDFISELEKSGWKYLFLDAVDDEFFIMIKAEKCKRNGNKVIIVTKNISERDFVHLAEYFDKGNFINLEVKSIARELGIDKENDEKMLIDIIKIGFSKDKNWWDRVNQRGIEVLFEEVENKVWDLIKDPSLWNGINSSEMDFIVKEFLPHKFGLTLRENLKPSEIADRLIEKIFESYFFDNPSEEIKKFYKKLEDSKEMESAFLKSAQKFEEERKNDLIENMDKIVSRSNHPFFYLEKDLFNKTINDFLNTKNKDLLLFAKERAKLRNTFEDNKKGIYWNELAQLEVIFEQRDLSRINSLDEIIKAYGDFVWKFDRLDRILEISNLPQEIIEWARDEIDSTLKKVNSIWLRFYDPKENEITNQTGLLRRILEEEGKQAVIVADALRYELGLSIQIESTGIDKQVIPIIAMTPTITPVGMGALFSSGNVRKDYEEKNFFIVENETNKRISDVKSREENIKRIVKGIEIYSLEKIPSNAPEKLILTSRDLDEAGHSELLKFISREILNEIAENTKKLILSGYTVHIVSDHGFCLIRNANKTIKGKQDSFDFSGRYKLLSKSSEDLKYEKIRETFIAYADYNSSFDKNGEFYHGGISIQEVLIPHVIFKNKNKVKLQVSIDSRKDQLKILRKKRTNVVVTSNGLLDGEPRKVYIEVKKEKFDAKKPVEKGESIEIPIFFDAYPEEHFKIDLYDADDESHLDSIDVVYQPIREELF